MRLDVLHLFMRMAKEAANGLIRRFVLRASCFLLRASCFVLRASKASADTCRQFKLIRRAERAADRIAAMQLHVIAGKVHLGTLGQVIEPGPVERLLVAVVQTGSRIE